MSRSAHFSLIYACLPFSLPRNSVYLTIARSLARAPFSYTRSIIHLYLRSRGGCIPACTYTIHIARQRDWRFCFETGKCFVGQQREECACCFSEPPTTISAFYILLSGLEQLVCPVAIHASQWNARCCFTIASIDLDATLLL